MIGNDIVDLQLAKTESDWQRQRFLEKLFNEKEKKIINNSENKFLNVWRFWTMKEAAYKLYTQLNPSRFYAPKQFECSVNASNGKVNYKDFECYVNTKITSDYILSEARSIQTEIASGIVTFQTENTEIQSQFLKQKLLQNIAEKEQISISDLEFKKSEFGIPSVNFNTEKIDVSLTHHGRFGAFGYNYKKLSHFERSRSFGREAFQT